MIKSTLMIPADKQNLLLKIPNLVCDIAVVNLEDGVYDKKMARELIKKVLPTIQTNKKIVVRVNALNEEGQEDLKELKDVENIYGFRIPKIKTKSDVENAIYLCQDQKEIHLSIETKEAFANISKLKINSNVTTTYLGILDLLNSMGLSHDIITQNNPTINYILSKFLIDSLTNGFYPISFVYQDYKNLEEFKKWCIKEKEMGFGAKACISPKQVEIANKIFGFCDEVEKSKEIIQLFLDNQKNSISGFIHEKYGFIDEPIYKNALNIVAKYGS